MNRLARTLSIGVALTVIAQLAPASTPYLAEGWWLNASVLQDGTNRIVPESTALWSGGNVGSYPGPGSGVPSAPFNEDRTIGTLRLEQSAFGQMVAGPLGYLGASRDLHQLASREIRQGARYRFIQNQSGQVNIGGGAWDIRFPGVIDKLTGRRVVANDPTSNFDPERLAGAAQSYHAALRVNPSDVVAARGLLQTFLERMQPLTFAGNEAIAFAHRRRVLLDTEDVSGLTEFQVLETALDFYRQSLEVVTEASANPVVAALLDGSYAFIPSGDLVSESGAIFTAYMRALTLRAESLHHYGRLKYLAEYRDAVNGGALPVSLRGLLDSSVSEISDHLLLAGIFRRLPQFNTPELDQARFLLTEIGRLRTAMNAGRIPFASARADAGGSSYGDYTPEYVPFLFDPVQFANRTSFEILIANAEKFAVESERLDGEFLAAGREYDGNLGALRSRLSDVRSRYGTEIADLCGEVDGEDGPLQDVYFGLLPPGDREAMARRFLGATPYNIRREGRIYQQWGAIQHAATELDAAHLDLENTFSEMQKKEEIAGKIAQGRENIASLFLENGERLEMLERQEGELRADTILHTARVRRLAATRTAWINAIEGGVRGGISAYASGGGGGGAASTTFIDLYKTIPGSADLHQARPHLPLLAVAVVAGAATAGISAVKAHYEVSAMMRAARIESDLTRRLADIQAQRTHINTLERARVELQRRDEELYRTEEVLHALVLQANRQRLSILMASQRLDTRLAELANMVARVQSLLQEWHRADKLIATDPLASPDFRLLRDLRARDADEAFTYAQEAAFLAAKAGQYRINGSRQASDVETQIRNVLRARSGRQLKSAVANLTQQINRLYLEQGTTEQPVNSPISLRHFIVQNNFLVITNVAGDFDPTQSSLESFGDLTSDQAWLEFLRAHTSTNQSSRRRLDIVFSTSLQPLQFSNRDDPRLRDNPLFSETSFNSLIVSSASQREAYGVRVNVRGRGLLYNPNEPIVVNLRQEGASFIRTRPAPPPGQPDPNAIRVWNLQPVAGNLVAGVNGFRDIGSPQFHERSPASDRWVLSILEGEQGPGNGRLLRQLEQIADIELVFSISGFTGRGGALSTIESRDRDSNLQADKHHLLP